MPALAVLLALILCCGCAERLPEVGDLPKIVPARIGVIDSRTYTTYLEKAKGYERLENLLKQEHSNIQMGEIRTRSGISLKDWEKEAIRGVFSRYGSTDPLGDYFRLNQIDTVNRSCDPEGQCYLLDDLANLYTYFLVDFRKAQDYNKKAADLYERLRRAGIENIPLSDYYNARRSLYYTFFYRLEGEQPPGFAYFPGRIDLISPFGKKELDTIRQLDFARLGERIREREGFLKQKLADGADLGKAKDFQTIGYRDSLLVELERSLRDSGRYNSFELPFYLTEHAFLAYAAGGDARYLPHVTAYGRQALAAPRPEGITGRDAVNKLHLWIGLAALKSDRPGEGIRQLEQFLKGIDAYETLSRQAFEKRQAVLKRVNAETMEREQRAALWAKVFIVAAIAAGTAGAAQAHAQVQAGGMSQANFNMIHQNYMNALGTGIQMMNQIQVGMETLEQQTAVRAEISRYVTPLSLKVNRYLDKYQMVDYFLELGKAYEAVGKREKALENYDEAIRIIERQRRTVYTEKERISFFRAGQELYERVVALLVKMGRPEQALEYAERARSRAFVDILGSRRLQLKSPSQTDVYRQRTRQLSEIDALLSDKQVGVSQLNEVLKKAQRSVQVKGRGGGPQADPEVAALSDVGTLTAGDIKKLAEGGSVILEYFFARSQLILFVVDARKVRALSLTVDPGKLARHAENWRKKIQARQDAREEERYFYEALIAPAAGEIRGKEAVVIPHGILHYLPFQAMHDGRQYLIEQCALSYSPSATVLKFTMEKTALGTGKILVFANPTGDLAFAEEEARQIVASLPGTTLRSGRAATETLFKKRGGEFDIIHLAAHGRYEAREPLDSAVVLGGDGVNDGNLRAAELFSISLNASLVTLSACETGLSARRTGDELIGLQRGLIFAGARSVVSSLWPVDDAATSVLMQAFYRNMQKMDKSRALQMAQQETMHRYARPYFWAAFNLTGPSR